MPKIVGSREKAGFFPISIPNPVRPYIQYFTRVNLLSLSYTIFFSSYPSLFWNGGQRHMVRRWERERRLGDMTSDVGMMNDLLGLIDMSVPSLRVPFGFHSIFPFLHAWNIHRETELGSPNLRIRARMELNVSKLPKSRNPIILVWYSMKWTACVHSSSTQPNLLLPRKPFFLISMANSKSNFKVTYYRGTDIGFDETPLHLYDQNLFRLIFFHVLKIWRQKFNYWIILLPLVFLEIN